MYLITTQSPAQNHPPTLLPNTAHVESAPAISYDLYGQPVYYTQSMVYKKTLTLNH